jgi:hypothetical protein
MADLFSKGSRRRVVSLLIAFTFLVMAVTGVLAFFQPFSIQLVGLHSLMGFVFIAFILAHIANNGRNLKTYLKSPLVWLVIVVSMGLSALFFFQPAPVKAVLRLSENLGPALDRFEATNEGMVYQYHPSDDYQLKFTLIAGPAYDVETPPRVAIWLENQGGYHIKTLRAPDEGGDSLPYWRFKRAGWAKAKSETEKNPKPDAVSSPTPNGSFDPADYILPADPETSTPYKLLIEINDLNDGDQPSLVYAVEIDNLDPRTFQLLELVGYPVREDREGKEAWELFFIDESVTTALELIDSALLEIKRGGGN